MENLGPETQWDVPATAAAGVATRDLTRLFGNMRTPYPDNLLVDNTRNSCNVVVTVNGKSRPVPAGGTVEIRKREVGQIQAYNLVPTAAVAAAAVTIYERRVGNGGVA